MTSTSNRVLNRLRLRSSAVALAIIFLIDFSKKTIVIRGVGNDTEDRRNLNTNHGEIDSDSRYLSRPTERNTNGPDPKIPHNIIFTYRNNIFKTKEPGLFYKNVLNTVKAYKDAWNDPDAPIIVLDDERCFRLINRVEPRLAGFFRNEAHGPFKSDICRIAALFVHGGYYFDIDIEVVKPLLLPPTTTFVTPYRQGHKEWFFQAFLASARGHPILRNALEAMLMAYMAKLDFTLLGPETLKWAFDSTPEDRKQDVLLLEEFSLETNYGRRKYPDFPRHCANAIGCNFVVHDPNTMVIYFYSRVMGSSKFREATYSDSWG